MIRHPAALNVDGHAAPLRHLIAVAHERKARHIRAAVDAEAQHDIPRGLVERRHLAVELLQQRLLHQIGFCRRRDDADAERLCQDQRVARLRVRVGQHLFRMDEARHGQAVDRLRAVDRMPAGDDGPGLIRLVIAAAQDLAHGVAVHLVGQTHHVQRQLRLAAHRIDITQRVRRRNLPVEERVIDDRRKEVCCLYDGDVVRDLVDARVVALVVADEKPRVAVRAEALEHPAQRPSAHLRAAAGAGSQLRELDISLHVHPPSGIPRRIPFPPRGRSARSPRRRRPPASGNCPRTGRMSRTSWTSSAARASSVPQCPPRGRAAHSALHRSGRKRLQYRSSYFFSVSVYTPSASAALTL